MLRVNPLTINIGLLCGSRCSFLSSFIMSSNDVGNQSYHVDSKSVESQSPSSKVHTTLHRKLKNRHVAMIRYIWL